MPLHGTLKPLGLHVSEVMNEETLPPYKWTAKVDKDTQLCL